MITLFVICMIVIYTVSALVPEKDVPDPFDSKEE